MCQSQLSSPMLPSAAPMPPWAATVCDRVGNTLESTATLNPASASCIEARMPAPPAPTITASNFLTGMAIGSEAPEDLNGPAGIGDQDQDCEAFVREPQGGLLGVVHEDVAHADPGM